jgi:prepilin-type N-terminal cleavage/methylation domain-containing protein
MMRRRFMKRSARRGVTLIEVLLAIGLIALVSGMMFAFYDATLRSREWGVRRMGDNQLGRLVAMKIGEELKCAMITDLDGKPGVSGKRRELTIWTTALPDKESFYPRSIKDDPLPAGCDIRKLQYYLAYDDEQTHDYADGTQGSAPLGLVRSELKNPFPATLLKNDPLVVDLDLLAPELKYLRFRFYAGKDWWDDWQLGQGTTATPAVKGQTAGGVNQLPLAVEVTLGSSELSQEQDKKFDLSDDQGLEPSVPEPYSSTAFTCVFRLPQADETLIGPGGSKALDLSTRRGGSGMGGSSGSSGSGF